MSNHIEYRRLEWLMKKSRHGTLTKQEQLELGNAFLTASVRATKRPQ
ncbi:hypothetical protein OS242_12910 [Tumebacillus sp. DT12]|uniref:Uncharacterized protein n=1 Tax=Tumebacillus lacus TaxID=2995335 RepID=A0ABT3X1Q4_9BACL|nr:hypothetical protein [Tumebacillus lacus]MCX7570857.1 hypothetical protein [Tumebacillus lacus]